MAGLTHAERAQWRTLALAEQQQKRTRWVRYTQHSAVTRRNSKILAITCLPMAGHWSVVAIETRIELGGSVQRVLGNHAHTALGDYPTLDKAKAASERYLRAWRRGGRSAARCACKTIQKGARR